MTDARRLARNLNISKMEVFLGSGRRDLFKKHLNCWVCCLSFYSILVAW